MARPLWRPGLFIFATSAPRRVLPPRRRRDVITAAPDFRLRLAVLGRGLGLVQPLQRAIVTFVQPPALLLGNPHRIEYGQRDPQRADRTLQHRRVRDVEDVSAFAEKTASLFRLGDAALGEIDVGPAGEPVFFVPGTLA